MPSPRSSSIKQLYWLLGGLVSLLVLAKLISFFLALNQPLGLKPSGEIFSWDQKSSVNLVFVSPKSESETEQFLVNYSPKSEKITILEISPQTYTELPKGYGWWKVGSVYKLGQDEKVPRGGELLEQSISKLIGLPIDGLIVLDKPLNMDDLIKKMRANRLEIFGLISSVSSDLTPIQAANLFWRIAEVRSDKIFSLNFLQSNVTESKLLPDSSRVLGVNTVRLDLFIRDNLAEENITQEDKSIALFNATNHPGLTVEASRLLTNMGGDVIFTSNAQIKQEKTQVVFAKEEQSPTAQRLTQIFAPFCLPDGCRSNDPKVLESRAQVNIILGEDYWKLWYER